MAGTATTTAATRQRGNPLAFPYRPGLRKLTWGGQAGEPGYSVLRRGSPNRA